MQASTQSRVDDQDRDRRDQTSDRPDWYRQRPPDGPPGIRRWPAEDGKLDREARNPDKYRGTKRIDVHPTEEDSYEVTSKADTPHP